MPEITATQTRIRVLPKAELHLHLEGSLAPEALWRLAQQQKFPYGLNNIDKCRNLYRFDGFSGFIQAIKTASQLLQTPDDYAFAAGELAQRLQSQGVVYAEVFLSVGILLWRQVPIEPYWEAVQSATQAAEAATGVRMRWLLDAVRQFGTERFEQVVDWGIKLQRSDLILGIGVGGDETQIPMAAFAPGYGRARAAGLHTTMHAGETAGPSAVREAIELLHVERLGHALTASQEPAVMDLIAACGTKIDSCQISNHKTGVWDPRSRHPVRKFFEAGLRVSVSSDDPGIFGSSLLDEYALLEQVNGFAPAEVLQMADNAWECSFLSPAERGALRLLPPLATADAGGD